MNEEFQFKNWEYKDLGMLGAYIVEKNNESYKQIDVNNVKQYIKDLIEENQQLKEKLQQKEDNINKAQEEFISEFYSCDNEEEALKRLYSKLCCLKEEKQELIDYLKKEINRLSRVAENRYDKVLELEQENEQLKEQLQANKKARKEAIKYINVTEYSDIVGLNKNGIKEFWFVKDILKILDIDKGE